MPHYIDFRDFVDIDQDFVPAQGLCINDGDGKSTPISRRLTTQSAHDCAARCNNELDCALFTYNQNTESDCILYTNETSLKDSCSGIIETTFVMYTSGKFTELPGACLRDESDSLLLTRKTIVECAALCNKWFNCRSFRIDQDAGECRLFEEEMYSLDLCTGDESLGDLYGYYSDSYYVSLSDRFCVASNSIIGEVLENVPLEACKILCDASALCVSLEHNQEGDCALYSSSDFSIPCVPTEDRTLYISYKDVVELGRNKYEYKPMQGCFDLTSSNDWKNVSSEEDCQDFCTGDCFGYQYNGSQCNVLQGELQSIKEECGVNETFSFRVERFPYQKMNNTCLRNEIYDPSDPSLRIENTEEYECLALCDAHAFCRYYLYGTDPAGTSPAFRECKLFKAQAQELDDCDCSKEEGFGDYCGLSAFVNGRTFVDTVSWFGEPDFTYATLSGIGYQECAALCDSLDNQFCAAFIHTWNYRRSSSSVQPEIFRPTRIIRADFAPGDDIALFLQFDDNGALVMSTAREGSDDALKSQQLINEQTGNEQTFRIRFWKRSGNCIAASNSFSELPSGFAREEIFNNFGNVPTCQTVDITACDDQNAIEFTAVDYLNAINPGRFALSYKIPNTNANISAVGCLGVQPLNGRDFWTRTLPKDDFGSMSISLIEECGNPMNVSSTCTKVMTATTTEWKPHGCNQNIVQSKTCQVTKSIQIDESTIQNTTECIFPPEDTCGYDRPSFRRSLEDDPTPKPTPPPTSSPTNEVRNLSNTY